MFAHFQILLNLCENSIKFTSAPGSITLSVRLLDCKPPAATPAPAALDHRITIDGAKNETPLEHKEDEIPRQLSNSTQSLATVTIEWSVTDTGETGGAADITPSGNHGCHSPFVCSWAHIWL